MTPDRPMGRFTEDELRGMVNDGRDLTPNANCPICHGTGNLPDPNNTEPEVSEVVEADIPKAIETLRVILNELKGLRIRNGWLQCQLSDKDQEIRKLKGGEQ